MKQVRRLYKFALAYLLILPFFVLAQSPAPNSGANVAPVKSDRAQFLECLQEYKNFPKIVQDEQFSAVYNMALIQLVDESILNLLPAGSLNAKYAKFNNEFQLLKSSQNKKLARYIVLDKENKAIPLSIAPEFQQKKIKIESVLADIERQLGHGRTALVLKSLDCNNSVLEYVTLDPKSRGALEAKNKAASLNLPERKNVPGRYQGSRVEREKKAESEKKNLTPLDGEFYQTKLGKKLQNDLGGPIDYWSYDYQRDELYVQVGNEVAKVYVQVGPDGARFVKTKVGPSFDVPKVDLKVDQNADGRFLTGDKNQETLFGKMPSKDPKLEDEQPTHGSGRKDPHDGHDH